MAPAEWAKVLDAQSDAVEVAKRLKSNGHLPWNELLLRELAEARTVLDLGSGHGENSAILALQDRETTLLDWSRENLDFGKRLFDALGRRGTFVRHDMTKPLPFGEGVFDAVFSCGVFEYFSDQEVVSILKEGFRVAKKRVIVLVPNAWALLYRLGMWYQRRSRQWPWGGERPLATLRPHFQAAGCRQFREFTVAAKHSLNFLTMPGGRLAQKAIQAVFRLRDHAQPSRFRQGYLLVAVGEKWGEEVRARKPVW